MKYHQPRHIDVPTIARLLHCILTLETVREYSGGDMELQLAST